MLPLTCIKGYLGKNKASKRYLFIIFDDNIVILFDFYFDGCVTNLLLRDGRWVTETGLILISSIGFFHLLHDDVVVARMVGDFHELACGFVNVMFLNSVIVILVKGSRALFRIVLELIEAEAGCGRVGLGVLSNEFFQNVTEVFQILGILRKIDPS